MHGAAGLATAGRPLCSGAGDGAALPEAFPEKGETRMTRWALLPAALGLVLAAALPARAAEVTLFGKKYNIVTESRAQTYKNGLRVVLPDPSESNRKATMFFVEGADPSQDRLFVAAAISQSEDITGHQLYLLTGADANGVFSKDSASLTEFFGGNQNYTRGGRPVSVVLLNDANTGVKTDRNLLVFNFADVDALRVYDLDTMTGSYDSDALLAIVQPEENPEEVDPGFPHGDFESMAPGPNGTVLVAGRAAPDDEGIREDIEIGVLDPAQGKFLNVKTGLKQVTADSTVKLDPQEPNTEPHGLIRVSDTEYWMLVSGDQQGNNNYTETNYLYRMQLTFPADMATAGPNSIKVNLLARESLSETPMATSSGGVFGIAVGREVNGGRRLYMADWQGNIHTLTPAP
jgi:hypothetical protein